VKRRRGLEKKGVAESLRRAIQTEGEDTEEADALVFPTVDTLE
jgi:hypothetical protein